MVSAIDTNAYGGQLSTVDSHTAVSCQPLTRVGSQFADFNILPDSIAACLSVKMLKYKI